MTVYIRQRRSLPKRASSKAQVLEGRKGSSKSAFRRGTVPSDVRKSVLVGLAKSLQTDQQKTLRRRKIDSAVGTASSMVGLAGAAAFGGAQIKRGRIGAAIKPYRATLERASLGTAVGGGALAGYSGLRSANTSRRMISEEERRLKIAKSMMPTGLSVPRGLRQRKTYTASSVRAVSGGRLVRTKAGVR